MVGAIIMGEQAGYMEEKLEIAIKIISESAAEDKILTLCHGSG